MFSFLNLFFKDSFHFKSFGFGVVLYKQNGAVYQTVLLLTDWQSTQYLSG